MTTILDNKKSYPIYSANDIKQWELRWFKQSNSSFGLMNQASLLMANCVENLLLKNNYDHLTTIIIWCGIGNNGGDGYLLATFLKQKNFNVIIYAPHLPASEDCQKAKQIAVDNKLIILDTLDFNIINNHCINGDMVHIDALFGNGLNKNLDITYQAIINDFNHQNGLKIALDIPSGLHPDTGNPMPVAIWVNYTLCLVGLKMGLLTGQGKGYAGQIIEIPLIPQDNQLTPLAKLDTYIPTLPKRKINAHKGDFGHLAIIGGHKTMGGAVILAGESAFACGVGKVTIICDTTHHSSILARNPNIMVWDINDLFDDKFIEFLKNIDSLAFGMGLGRDEWGEKIYLRLIEILNKNNQLTNLILDADSLYFLAKYPINLTTLANKIIATPHSAESARLLNSTVQEIESDRVMTINQLYNKFGGNWVLKGAGSLSLEYDKTNNQTTLSVCAFGNPHMATAGMGDVLSGMIGGLLSLNVGISLAECVSLHALAGDKLFELGQGVSSDKMAKAVKTILTNNT